MEGYMKTEFINEDGSLALSKRTIQCLVNENIFTKKDLINRYNMKYDEETGLLSRHHLLCIKGLGRKSYYSIVQYVKKLND
jgi:DNA-directed RNA polymerase alpha subunit